MNRFQDLMRSKTVVRVVVDTFVDEFHVQVIDGIVSQAGNNYVEMIRDATAEEKIKHNVEKVKVVIPLSRVVEVMCYDSN
jgi:uncharacterized membrane-anchored protein YjiN (DUF445 family)